MVKSMASALGSMIGGSSAKKEAAPASTNGKQGLTTSDSTNTLASSASGGTLQPTATYCLAAFSNELSVVRAPYPVAKKKT